MSTGEDAYLGEHIRDALAHDDAVAELDIQVTVTTTRIVLTGQVADEASHRAVDEVLARLDLRGHAVSNSLSVMQLVEPTDRERLT